MAASVFKLTLLYITHKYTKYISSLQLILYDC
jgi:hypothetical protein